MAATDPAGAQKFWHVGAGGTFHTLTRTGIDPGSQKWWMAVPGIVPAGDYTLDGLVYTAPPPVGTYRFPALTVAG